MIYKNINLWLVFIGTVGLLLFIVFSLSDIQTVVKTIPDDSFYYFQIASNFISGKGSSLDGIRTTNGYHPLWMIMISPFFKLKGHNEMLPIRFVIILAGILTIATAYVVYRITMIITQRKILAVFAFGAYIFSSNSFFSNISGEPVPLSNFLVVIGLLITLEIVLREKLSWRDVIIFGVISGLTVLARTDNAVFVFTYFILILLWYRKEGRFIKVGTAGLITLFTVLPWFIWSLIVLGTIKQASFDASPYLYWTKILKENPDISFYVIFYGTSINRLLNSYFISFLFGYSPFNIGLLIIIGALFGAFKENDQKFRKSIITLLILTGVVFLLYFLHTAVMLYLRFWHIAIFSAFTILIIVSSIKIYIKQLKTLIILITVLSVIYFMVFTTFLYGEKTNPSYSHQIDMLKAAEYINKDKEHMYAVYDSGIISYFTDGKILSIDGNVNPEAYRAVKECRIYDYMIENNVDYFVGMIGTNNSIYEPFWGHPFDEIFEPVKQNDDGMKYEFNSSEYGVCRLKKLESP
jgi:hypothetical protein